MGDMSTEPFDVDFAAWIYSHEGSKMWSIGPRDVRHEHCFWWSPGFSNSKFVNQASLSSGKVRTSLEHPLLYNYMKDTGFFSAGLTFSSSGCCGSLAALVTHATYKWIPPHFSCRRLPFRNGRPSWEIRFFQLDSAGTWFQSSHWKLPSCNWRKKTKTNLFEIKSICKDWREKRPRGQDAKAAYQAAEALCNLLELQGSAPWTGLPPEPTAHAVLGAMRRHPKGELVQWFGCGALHGLCAKFAELRTALQRDPSVYATVRAAAEVRPSLETRDWYPELCVWLQPPCLVWRVRYRWGVGHNGPVRRAHMVASQFYSSHFSHGLLLCSVFLCEKSMTVQRVTFQGF